jgi:hypothetical protein
LNSRICLSVVVAASDSAQAVAGCVASLSQPGWDATVEVVVVAARDRIPRDQIPPGVTWVVGEAGATVPRLRKLGLDRSSGPIVAFTEDSCRLAQHWIRAWRRAFEDPRLDAATGPVQHAPRRSRLDWAVVFCEYAPFLDPDSARPPCRLAGNNFAVRRGAVQGHVDGPELQECQVLQAATKGGGGVRVVAEATACHVRRFGLREAIHDRVRCGLEFGRLRTAEMPMSLRLLGVGAGPAILLAQAGRLALTLLASPRYRGRFLDSLPMTLALLSAWSVGEWLGWVSGAIRGVECRRRGTEALPHEQSPVRPAVGPRDYTPEPVAV